MTARGLEATDGALWARGPSYKARLGANGITFVPALGQRSPRTRELRLEVLEFGRRDGTPLVAAATEPSGNELSVRYVRNGMLETYDVDVAGLEQTFVFASLPVGSGDLVVRLRTTTDLPLELASAREVRFVDPQCGGVFVRDVIGVDAAGRRAHGSMRCERDESRSGAWQLELSLPAAFVDGAALPLALDPMIGTVLVPGVGPEDSYPDVAYEPTTDRYFVAWARSYSPQNVDVLGQRLDHTGSPVGGLVTVRSGLIGSPRVRAVAVDAMDSFVVAWWEGGVQTDAAVAAVHAATGVAGPALVLSAPATNESNVDLGVASDQDNAAIVVWQSQSAIVQGTRVTVLPSGSLTSGPIVGISPPAGGRNPSVSHGRANGRLLVSFYHATLSRIDGAVIDANVQTLAPVALVAVTPFLQRHAIDGDGDAWLCAYEAGNNLTTGDLFGKRVTWDASSGQAVVGPVVPLATSATFAERLPAVGWLGNAAAVGHLSADFVSATFATSPSVLTVDGHSCTACEPAAPAVTRGTGYSHFELRVAVRRAAPGAAAEVLFVYNEDSPTGVAVNARTFRSDDGLEWDRGGGCGGGTAGHTCARTGNTNYTLRLSAAPPLLPTLLLLGVGTLYLPCGCGTVVPDPGTGTALAMVTSAAGAATAALPIPAQPSLVGFALFEQWATFAPNGTCFGFATSNALEVQIQ